MLDTENEPAQAAFSGEFRGTAIQSNKPCAARRIHLAPATALDADLALLYNVETRALVQAIKRNARRFPADFMFQLTEDEWLALRSQNVTSKGRGGRRYAPYAFTEHGALMLSSALNSKTAAEVGIAIVRTFVQLREMLSTHKEFAAKLEALDASKPDGTPRKLLDVSRMNALGWQAGLNLQDGLKCAYHDFMRHSAHQPV